MNPDHLHTNIKNTKKLLIRSLAPCVYLLVHSAVFLSAAAEILRQKEVRSEQPVAFHLPVISDPDVTSASTNNQIFASSPAAGISSFFSLAVLGERVHALISSRLHYCNVFSAEREALEDHITVHHTVTL